jgi:hypothetical protein
MKKLRGMELQLQTFVTSALDGCRWEVSILGHISFQKRAPDNYWTEG